MTEVVIQQSVTKTVSISFPCYWHRKLLKEVSRVSEKEIVCVRSYDIWIINNEGPDSYYHDFLKKLVIQNEPATKGEFDSLKDKVMSDINQVLSTI